MSCPQIIEDKSLLGFEIGAEHTSSSHFSLSPLCFYRSLLIHFNESTVCTQVAPSTKGSVLCHSEVSRHTTLTNQYKQVQIPHLVYTVVLCRVLLTRKERGSFFFARGLKLTTVLYYLTKSSPWPWRSWFCLHSSICSNPRLYKMMDDTRAPQKWSHNIMYASWWWGHSTGQKETLLLSYYR